MKTEVGFVLTVLPEPTQTGHVSCDKVCCLARTVMLVSRDKSYYKAHGCCSGSLPRAGKKCEHADHSKMFRDGFAGKRTTDNDIYQEIVRDTPSERRVVVSTATI
ncbi:hypothetical protein BV898_13209 [Hypsibius exemplaris]|uniref:Uncharacterized protein n=1 Tax=Hypsibius exemplaris TaxID=2072580 RepID=A0A1W0WBG8_HYPEX|nr:hypothetical protein BV898_13209 [Hypsibius exemplaris]